MNSSRPRAAWAAAAVLTLGFVTADALLFHSAWTRMYPIGDEFALISTSSHWSSDWFLAGYSKYFIVYPEWTSGAHFNLLRPVANLVYWCFTPFSEFRHQLQLLVVNYGVHALIGAGIFLVSALLIGNSWGASLALALAGYLAPAFFDSPMTVYPCYALDAIAALLGLGSVALVTLGRDLPAVAVFLLAVFTKESAVPLVAASFCFALLHRRRTLAIGCVANGALWLLLRWIAFGELGGTYSSDDLGARSALARIIANLPHLPMGNVDNLELRHMLTGGPLLNLSLLFVLVNGLIVLLLGVTLARRRWRSRPPVPGEDRRVATIFELALWGSALSVAFFATLGGEVRYAYVFFTMFVLLVASLPTSAGRQALQAILIIAGVVGALSAVQAERGRLDALLARYQGSRDLIRTLADAPTAGGPIWVLDDFVGMFSAEPYLARFADHSGPVARLGSIDVSGCANSGLAAIASRVERVPDGFLATVVLPRCARFAFEGIDGALLANLHGRTLARGTDLEYVFPHLATPMRPRQAPAAIDFGDTVQIHLRANARLLYYDFSNRRWIFA